MKKKSIMNKAAALFLTAVMGISPVISSLPVYAANSQPATYSEETDDYVVLDDDSQDVVENGSEDEVIADNSSAVDLPDAGQDDKDVSDTAVEGGSDGTNGAAEGQNEAYATMMERIKDSIKVTGDDEYYEMDYSNTQSVKKTFSVNSDGGTLTILKTDGTVLDTIEAGEEYTLDYFKGTDAPDEVVVYAQADDGYLVENYTGQVTDDGISLDMASPAYGILESYYTRSHYLVSEEADETFAVTFVKEEDADPANYDTGDYDIMPLSDIEDIDWGTVQAGQVFKGSAKIDYHRAKTKTYNGTGKIKMTSGALSGNWFKMKKCDSGHNYWAPTNGMTGSYTFTVREVDLENSKVKYRIKWVPSNSKAYQTLATSAEFTIPTPGELTIQKQAVSVEPDGEVMLPANVDLTTSFGVYTDAECTKLAEIEGGQNPFFTDSNGSKVVTGLTAGKYWVKEEQAPAGLKADATPQQVDISTTTARTLVFNDEYWTTDLKLFKKARGTDYTDVVPSMAGAMYKLYTDAGCTTEAAMDAVLNAGEDPGQSDTEDMPIVAFVGDDAQREDDGSYPLTWGYLDQNGNAVKADISFAVGTKFWIKEVQAPSNGVYELDPDAHALDLSTKEVYEAAAQGEGALENLIKAEYSVLLEDLAIGYLKLHKTADVNVKDIYGLAGAVYGIYRDEQCQNLVQTLTTDENGDTSAVELDCTDYYVKEIKSPTGYGLDAQVYPVTVASTNTSDNPVIVTSNEETIHKEFTIHKIAGNMDSGAPALDNAEFTVKYYGADAERKNLKKTWVIKTVAEKENDQTVYKAKFDDAHKVSGDAFYKDSTGKVVLPMGYYSIEETKAPENYVLENATFDGKAMAEAKNFAIQLVDGAVQITNNFEIVGNEAIVRNEAYGGIIINKVDAETGKPYPLGGASLKDITFGVYNASGHTIMIKGKEYADGDEVVQVTTDENGVAKTGEYDLLTDGTTYEVKELKSNGTYLVGGSVKITLNKGGYTEAANGTDYADQVVRGDFEFSKKDFKTQKPMGGVQFKITSVTTGESHVVTTDANGYYSSASSYVPHSKDTNSGDTFTGTWFGVDKEGNVAPVNDELGALPYDTYDVEELAGDNNKGKILVSFTVTINRDKLTVNMGTINDFDENKASISTTAIDKDSKSHIGAPATKSVIIDRVAYKNLKENHEYKLVTTLMNKETSTTVMGKDGQPVSLESTFTTEEIDGYINVNITFDSLLLNGGTAVVFEKLYDGDELVAHHEDIGSEDQSVSYPSLTIGTTAIDTDTKEHIGVTSENAVLRDTISYENLKADTEYTIVTALVNKATGENIELKNGEKAVSHVFTPKKSKDSVYVEVSFDATKLNGGSVVAFEKIYVGDELIASHEDLDAEDQTVFYPALKTNAKETENGGNLVIASDKISVTDTVHYKGVLPGKKLTVNGTLLDKATGEPVLDKNGKKVTASVEIKPEESEGQVDVVFEFDGSNLTQGIIMVASEELEYKGTVYCVHSDLNDADQTVYVPGIKTEAICDDTGLHIMYAGKPVTIVDTVTYAGLLTKEMLRGDTYKVAGTLMDADTGEKIQVKDESGKLTDVTASEDFVPDESNGKVEVRFNFDTKDLKGKNIVVFEKLYRVGTETGEETLIASHEDLKDEGQTVHTPEIKTTLTNKETGTHHATAKDGLVLVDTISYTGLIPQKTYTVSGVLKDQSTGKSILVDGKEVTAEATFTPETENGSVEVEFTLNASALSGKTIVAFEKLTHQGKEIAAHEDLTDKDQSVAFPQIHTTATDSSKKSHMIMASMKAVIVDTVSYSGLIPGKEYTLSGYLVDKESGDALKAGLFSKVEGKTVFTPDKADGEEEVNFEFDASDLGGKKVVVFEELTCDGEKKPVAEHKDKDDEDQSISIPQIQTSATNENKKLHVVKADEKAAIIDTVTYKGLVKDEKFTLKAEIMDPESKDATGITAEQEFTAEGSEGSVDVRIELDASKYAGKSLVVFETLSTSGDGKSTIIAEHRDLKDTEQTVTIPKVETAASDGADGDQKMKPDKDSVIVDKVTMEGLESSKEVKLVGTVMDKATGKVLAVDGKEVTAETTFKAKSGSFEKELKFTFNATGLKDGDELVVFEKLYDAETGEEIGSHEDLESKSQTITISGESEKDKETKEGGSDKSSKGVSTSDAVGFIIVFLLLGAGAITAGVLIRKRRYR